MPSTAGVEAGAITQNPIGIGSKCVDAAIDAINGKALPKNIDTGFYLVRQDEHQQPRDPGGPLQVGRASFLSRPYSGGCPLRGQPPVTARGTDAEPRSPRR